MNTGQVKTLAVILVVLLVGIFLNSLSNRQESASAGDRLFPDLRSRINEITQVSITNSDGRLTARVVDDRWVLAEREDYAVDTGKLRQLLLALADATTIEQKTSNPAMYDKLGVEVTSAESSGAEIRIVGPDTDAALILGNVAQRKYRYARIPGQAESLLIDQNPTLPGSAGDWLAPEIVDIDSSRVKSVTVKHADGETIRIEKADSEATSFDVPDLPEGRELSYAGVVNGMAGVLNDLNLQDVASRAEADADGADATTVFETFDGLEITVSSVDRDEETWITVDASQDAEGSDEAAAINERLGAWQYQIQRYKGDQLRRRWDDILKAEE